MYYHMKDRSNSQYSTATCSLSPANEVCEGYVFTGVCLSTGGGGCMVVGGHAWLQLGMNGCSRGCIFGGCMVEGVWLQGACMVVGVWLQGVCMAVGGMHGCGGCACVGYNEIWSMSRRYASYWNAFLFKDIISFHDHTADK